MAHHKSAIKSIKKTQEQRIRNRSLRTRLRGEVKQFNTLVEDGKLDEAAKALPATVSRVMRSETKGIVHRKTAARRVARLSRALHKAQVAAKA